MRGDDYTRRKNKKFILSTISVLLVCLIASTATITLADWYFGNLKIGDKMKWKQGSILENPSRTYTEYEIEILEIQESILTVNHKKTWYISGEDPRSAGWKEVTYSADYFWPYITPEESIKEGIDPHLDMNTRESDYTWEGIHCKAAYLTYRRRGYKYEYWWDYETGILLGAHKDPLEGGAIETIYQLISTTATLTPYSGGGGGCFGTILIALVTVTTVIVYSNVHFQKRKNI